MTGRGEVPLTTWYLINPLLCHYGVINVVEVQSHYVVIMSGVPQLITKYGQCTGKAIGHEVFVVIMAGIAKSFSSPA